MDQGHEISSDYHTRVDLFADRLAKLMETGGLDPALELAQSEEAGFRHDYRYLMNRACNMLFTSGDPNRYEPGFKYMEWEAQNFPDSATANGIAYSAKFDARVEGGRDFVERFFLISLMHFNFASQAEGFEPTVSFLEDLSAATARMEEEGYPSLYTTAMTELGPLAIVAAISYTQPTEPEALQSTDYNKQVIDEVLGRLVGVSRETNPDLAELAKSLITTPLESSYIKTADADHLLTKALLEGDFNSAADMLTNNEDLVLINELWGPMLQRLLSRDEEAKAWGNAVIDTIQANKPDYFSEHAYADLFYGMPVGFILGILDRRRTLDTLVNPGRDPHTIGSIAAGAAQGFGMEGNDAGFLHLLAQTTHFEDSFIDALKENFQAGILAAASQITTDTEIKE